MDVDTDDELRMLRARAYGRGADIQQDQHALRRLHELEQRAGVHQVARPAKPEIVAPEALPKAVGPTPPGE
ncbi:hypothetical protein [Microbacterium lacusdiani]